MSFTKMKINDISRYFFLLMMIAGLAVSAPVMAQEPEEKEKEEDPWADVEFPFDDETLLNFFDANQEVSALNRQSQDLIRETVEGHGLSFDRFQQISRAAQMGALQDGAFTSEEIESFNTVAPQVTNLQRENQTMVQALVEDYEMSMHDYRNILNEFRRDRELQQYVSHLARERAREAILEERRREAERKMEEERQRKEEEENS